MSYGGGEGGTIEEKGEAVEGDFGGTDEGRLTSSTKLVKTSGRAEKGSASTVFDKGSEGYEPNMPKGAKQCG